MIVKERRRAEALPCSWAEIRTRLLAFPPIKVREADAKLRAFDDFRYGADVSRPSVFLPRNRWAVSFVLPLEGPPEPALNRSMARICGGLVTPKLDYRSPTNPDTAALL